jgi:organic hydroperoxide reductase OsmC/OhrA
MSEEPRFTLEMEHLQDLEYRVKFDWKTAPDLLMDEPEPLGQRKGPNASRVLAAAVANCLSASLMFCLRRSKAEPTGMKTEVTGQLARNERNRLRVGGIQVKIHVQGLSDQPSRLERCVKLFEDFCVVSDSVRNGIPVDVEVYDENGKRISPEQGD